MRCARRARRTEVKAGRGFTAFFRASFLAGNLGNFLFALQLALAEWCFRQDGGSRWLVVLLLVGGVEVTEVSLLWQTVLLSLLIIVLIKIQRHHHRPRHR
jgi:hypothetical protein